MQISLGATIRRPMAERVVVGMSGGVDSSLTAVLMQEQGFQVVGVTMKLWPCAEEDGGFVREDACCSPTETIDARAVASDAGVPHYVLDMEDEFRRGVVDDFLASYERGETPNPCIRCNESVKFGDLWKYAQSIGANASPPVTMHASCKKVIAIASVCLPIA